MIKVVDAVMGAGKTSAAIRYMNENPGERFLYITPFNDETYRIQAACPSLHFWTPSNTLSEFNFRKSDHLRSLIEEGRNVAITHALYMLTSSEVAALIAERKYTVFIDEVIDIFEPVEISANDLQIIKDSGWLVSVEREDGDMEYEYYEESADKKYQGGRFSELFLYAKSRRLVNVLEKNGKQRFHFWTLHKELFALSDKVFLLTYMFDGMPLRGYFEVNDIPYEYMGVERDSHGAFRFVDTGGLRMNYMSDIGRLIHICENDKLNRIGERDNALSVSWTKNALISKSDGRLDKLRKNINTFFRNYCPVDIKASRRLWCVFSDAVGSIREKGFWNCDLAWNSRATNRYSGCKALAYCVNVYLNPNLINYYKNRGASVDACEYAVANMVQWIYRSAIRNGEEIWLYVPSSRMRNLLKAWLESVSSGVSLREVLEGGDAA